MKSLTSYNSLSLVDFLQSTGHRWLSEQFSESLAAFETLFRVIGVNLKVGTSFLKRISGRIVRISTVLVSVFREARGNLFLIFSPQKGNHILLLKTISAFTENTDFIFKTFTKIFIS
jgi:hypothetical protein